MADPATRVPRPARASGRRPASPSVWPGPRAALARPWRAGLRDRRSTRGRSPRARHPASARSPVARARRAGPPA
ncbi:hypothetical protein G6F58_013149 [Rhizopus delemar]|nr:hypothetical protein G6F58_013149 [Rhizopus delemar]